jgi:hypothetical protein
MNETIKALIEPKRILLFSVLIYILDFAPVLYLAFPTKRGQWTQIRMHGDIHKPTIIDKALNISWTVNPIDAKVFDRGRCIVWNLATKLHDTANVIGLSRRFADKIDMIWRRLEIVEVIEGRGLDRSRNINALPLTENVTPSSETSLPPVRVVLQLSKDTIFVSRVWNGTGAGAPLRLPFVVEPGAACIVVADVMF